MKNLWVLPVAAVMLTGCDIIDRWRTDPAIRACEIMVKANLRSPSSYNRVKASIAGDKVYLEMDSQNGFGAMLRDVAICRFGVNHEDQPENMPASYEPPYSILAVTVGSARLERLELIRGLVPLLEAHLSIIRRADTSLNVE